MRATEFRSRAAEAALRVRWALVRWLAPRRPVLVRGLRLTLPVDSWITHYRWSTYGSKEPETLDWIDHRIHDGDVIFDVGANIGVYSLYAALRHPRSRIVAFEPEFANLHLLRDNVVENGLRERISMYALALGDRDGLTHLYVQDLTPGSALHSESAAPLTHTLSGRPVVLGEGIALMTLDRFCEVSGVIPDALKIDVDGTEPEILRGGARTLRDTALRTVLIEIPAAEGSAAECRRLLRSVGMRRLDLERPAESGNEVWIR